VSVEFEGKVGLVTGGARGIGLSIADALVREGASVFICGRNPATLKTALGHLRILGAETSAAGIVADVRSYKDCRKVVQQAATQFGGVDILVNNAGIGIFKPIDHLTAEEWDASIQTNSRVSSIVAAKPFRLCGSKVEATSSTSQACSPSMVSPEAPPTVRRNSA
jgi:3-oxoacyl-[acyl-carrier protein] reductase